MQTRASTRSWPPHARGSPRCKSSRRQNRLNLLHPDKGESRT
jgi:hypothetical protein